MRVTPAAVAISLLRSGCELAWNAIEPDLPRLRSMRHCTEDSKRHRHPATAKHDLLRPLRLLSPADRLCGFDKTEGQAAVLLALSEHRRDEVRQKGLNSPRQVNGLTLILNVDNAIGIPSGASRQVTAAFQRAPS